MKAKHYITGAVLAVAMSVVAYAQPVFSILDIGLQRSAGRTVAANGGFDVSSATGDVWDLLDKCRLVYQQVSGDFDIRTRFNGLTGVAYCTKAGLIVREDLTEFGANGLRIAARTAGWAALSSRRDSVRKASSLGRPALNERRQRSDAQFGEIPWRIQSKPALIRPRSVC